MHLQVPHDCALVNNKFRFGRIIAFVGLLVFCIPGLQILMVSSKLMEVVTIILLTVLGNCRKKVVDIR